jgi:hypothetical protein
MAIRMAFSVPASHTAASIPKADQAWIGTCRRSAAGRSADMRSRNQAPPLSSGARYRCRTLATSSGELTACSSARGMLKSSNSGTWSGWTTHPGVCSSPVWRTACRSGPDGVRYVRTSTGLSPGSRASSTRTSGSTPQGTEISSKSSRPRDNQASTRRTSSSTPHGRGRVWMCSMRREYQKGTSRPFRRHCSSSGGENPKHQVVSGV